MMSQVDQHGGKAFDEVCFILFFVGIKKKTGVCCYLQRAMVVVIDVVVVVVVVVLAGNFEIMVHPCSHG